MRGPFLLFMSERLEQGAYAAIAWKKNRREMRDRYLTERRQNRSLITLVGVLFLAACGTPDTYVVPLMPAPIVFEDAEAERAAQSFDQEQLKVFYATHRPPTDDGAFPYYKNERAEVTRLGSAQLTAESKDQKWILGEALSASVSPDEVSLSLAGVTELGLLDESLSSFTEPKTKANHSLAGEKAFAQGINQQLARTKGKDIVIYVHGYKVPFPDPILVSAEFRHFLNYHAQNRLKELDKLMLVDVSKAEGSTKGNGHGYFRNSPWVSSDIVTTLRFEVPSEQRQLVRQGSSPIWEFPPDYAERITRAYPALKQGLNP